VRVILPCLKRLSRTASASLSAARKVLGRRPSRLPGGMPHAKLGVDCSAPKWLATTARVQAIRAEPKSCRPVITVQVCASCYPLRVTLSGAKPSAFE
jgi:hypothetical protein